jgi:hypothetical protein
LEGGHLVVDCTLNRTISSRALIDCGATGLAFVDETFASENQLELIPLHTPRTLEVIDGRQISSGAITHVVRFALAIGEHIEELTAFVTKLNHYALVLGIPWLKKHDVTVRFASNTFIFDSPQCCGHRQPIVVQGVEQVEEVELREVEELRELEQLEKLGESEKVEGLGELKTPLMTLFRTILGWGHPTMLQPNRVPGRGALPRPPRNRAPSPIKIHTLLPIDVRASSRCSLSCPLVASTFEHRDQNRDVQRCTPVATSSGIFLGRWRTSVYSRP